MGEEEQEVRWILGFAIGGLLAQAAIQAAAGHYATALYLLTIAVLAVYLRGVIIHG